MTSAFRIGEPLLTHSTLVLRSRNLYPSHW